jgi:hypothetical protein
MVHKVSEGRKASRWMAAGAAAAATVAGIGLAALPASAATGPSWSSIGRADVSGTVTAVTSGQWGSGTTGEWAFVSTALETNFKGYPSVYSRVNDGTWAKATLPGSEPGETFVSATAINNDDVLAFSAVPNGTGREWRFNGSTWNVIKTFDAPIGGASVTSAGNVWVFGSSATSDHLGVYHYNGSTWTKVASTLNGGQGIDETSAWAYTGTTVAHWNGTAWTGTNLVSFIPGGKPQIVDVYDTDGTMYAIGESDSGVVILVYNGRTWARVGAVAGVSAVPNQISSDGNLGIWFPVIRTDHGAAAVVHYIRTVNETAVTDLPGQLVSITRVENTFELAGGSVLSGKANPATYTELEYYN